MRTYVVADLHGRYDLLQKALAEIEKDSPSGGRFICLGDFVDRGPQSREIIERFMAGPPQNWEWIILQGNHEQLMIGGVQFPHGALGHWWHNNGAYGTLKSYGYPEVELEHCVPEEHVRWLSQLPVYYEDELRIYVHAGVPMDKDLEETKQQTLQWMMYRDGSSNWSDAEYHDDGTHKSGKHVVHGHVQAEHHPDLRVGRTNLDAWAYHTGRLAIGVFDEVAAAPKEILWVQA